MAALRTDSETILASALDDISFDDDENTDDDESRAADANLMVALSASSNTEASLVAALEALAVGVTSGVWAGDKKSTVQACAVKRKAAGAAWTSTVKQAFMKVVAALRERDLGGGVGNGAVMLRQGSIGETGKVLVSARA
jgi:hypothetical protein